MTQQLIGIPKNLLVYKPQQKTTALCWQVNLEGEPTLELLDFEVEIDVVVDLSSINKKTYTKDNIVNYQNGTFFKAFVIDDPLLFEMQKYYWRVRVNSENYISEWSDYKEESISALLDNMEYNIPTRIKAYTINASEIVIQKTKKDDIDVFDTFPYSSTEIDGLYERYTKEEFLTLLETNYGITDKIYTYVGPYEFNINQITWYDDTETAENLLPDNYVYTKIGNTNIKRIIELYMRLIGVFKNEIIQVANNYNYKKTQDQDLYDMLGVLLTYTRNTQEPFITYKYELLNLWKAYLHQGTIDAFNIIIETLYGVAPEIKILKDEKINTWHLYDEEDIDVQRYYLTDEVEYSSYKPNPYLYTNQYLAHNLLISIDNIYGVQIDTKILMEILNNLKPLNINISLYINDFITPYAYGQVGYYGNPHNYWGGRKN